jgi:CDP-2,3-bis-(O-geranylgeranyl)-sn-glycerol synthase
MFKDIFFALWFFLPAGLANMFPIFAAHFPHTKKYEYPMDFNLTYKGQRILGENKTIRGFAVGIVTAVLFILLQKSLYDNFGLMRELSLVNYSDINIFALGFLLGFGALFGDAFKSFFKRRLNVAPGKSWLVFDQLDYVLGGIVFSMLYLRVETKYYLWIIFIYFILHFFVSFIGFRLKLKSSPI